MLIFLLTFNTSGFNSTETCVHCELLIPQSNDQSVAKVPQTTKSHRTQLDLSRVSFFSFTSQNSTEDKIKPM